MAFRTPSPPFRRDQDAPDGLQGLQGEQGEQGAAGADGEGCSATDNGDGSYTIECPDGTTLTLP